MEGLFKRLVKEYQGPKISFILAGAGFNLTRIVGIPGVSRILAGIYMPYAQAELDAFTRANSAPAVSKERLMALLTGDLADPTTFVFVVTGSLITDHNKKGKMHAWMGTVLKQKEVTFPSLTETEYKEYDESRLIWMRNFQDEEITYHAIKMLLGE